MAKWIMSFLRVEQRDMESRRKGELEGEEQQVSV